MRKKQKVRICPKCKEAKLKNAVNVSGWLGADLYECTGCGYSGRFYIEIDLEDLKSDQEENPLK